MSRVLVKICGTTSAVDARLAADSGAGYLGIVVEHAPSPRSVTLANLAEVVEATALPWVAVTVNRDLDFLKLLRTLHPAALQLHGDEPMQLVRDLASAGAAVWVACSGEGEATRKRARAAVAAGASAVLLDARLAAGSKTIYGGSGTRADWGVARDLADEGLRVVLAGGLDPDNVADAVATVRPWMVDVVSGVEARKGIKDANKVQQFVAAAKAAGSG